MITGKHGTQQLFDDPIGFCYNPQLKVFQICHVLFGSNMLVNTTILISAVHVEPNPVGGVTQHFSCVSIQLYELASFSEQWETAPV